MSLPEITLPPIPPAFAAFAARLPQRPWSEALAAALETARIARLLPAEVDLLEGRVLGVKVQDLGIDARIRMEGGRLRGCRQGTPADVCFTAKAPDFLRILTRQEDPDTLFFQRRLRIEGDTELGLALKNLLDQWEAPGWLTRVLSRKP